MAQVSYGTITITDTTDKNIFIRYSANVDGSNSTSSPVSNTKYIGIYCGTAQTETEAMASSSGWTWSEYIGTDGVSVTGITEIYQLRNDSATPTKRSDGTALPTAVDTVNTWSLKVPSYVSGGTYWTSTAVSMSEVPSPRYTTPVKNEALTDSNYNSAMANSIAQSANENANGALSIATGVEQHFFWIGEDYSTSIPAGAYVAEKGKDEFKANPTGGNLITRTDGIYIRNGANLLSSLTGSALSFYNPSGNGEKIADYGSTITLGNSESISNKFNIKITNTTDTEDVWGNRGPGILLRRGKTVLTEMTETGLNIYGDYIDIGDQVTTWTKLASFGAETKIGVNTYTLINSRGVSFYNTLLENQPFGLINFYYKVKEDYQQSYSHEWEDYSELNDSYDVDCIIHDNLCSVSGNLEFIIDGDPSSTLHTDSFTYDLSKDDALRTLTYEDTIETEEHNIISYNLVVGVGILSMYGFNPLQCTIGHSASLGENSSLLSYFKINLNINYNTRISGPHYSFGRGCNSIGHYAFAMGNNTIAREDCQLTIGKFNVPTDDALFVIGNGTDDNNRSNLLVVDGDGNLLIQDGFKIVNTTGNCIQLTSDGMEIFKAAISVAKFGEITHVGSRNGTHLRVENNGLYLKDKALSIFQIKTEELDDGPEINLILYQNNNQLAAKERYSSGQSYLYRPKEVVIEFDDSSLSSGDTIDISTDFNGTASIYYNNQYNWVGLNGSGTLNITYGTSVNSLSYSQTISWQGTSRTITVFNLTYDGNNKIILETLTNSGASSDDASRYVRLNYYKNIKITASQQLSILPATIIGPQELSHVEIDYHSLQMIDKEQNVYFYISDLRDKDGYGTVTDHFTGDGDTIYFPFSSTPASSVSVKVGGATKVYGTDYTYNRDIGVTFVTAPSNGLSVIINYKTTDSTLKAFTFGIREPDYGLGKYSVVEGYYCIASGTYSYATGLWTEATARCAHAEGAVTVANGAYSHAQNECTIAGYTSQTTIGKYNDNQSDTALEIGNGTADNARSNALTVDWNGNVKAAGNITGINVNASNLIASNSIQVPKGKNIYLENDNYINKFYCGTAGGTDNIYYKTDGYHAFLTADSTTRFYIQNTQVNSNVPYKAGGVKLFTIGWTTEVDNAQIAANGYADYKITIPSKSNYTPIAVVGYYFANATTNGANSSSISCNMAYYVSAENKARLMCRNHASSAARVRYAAAILYVATTQGI